MARYSLDGFEFPSDGFEFPNTGNSEDAALEALHSVWLLLGDIIGSGACEEGASAIVLSPEMKEEIRDAYHDISEVLVWDGPGLW